MRTTTHATRGILTGILTAALALTVAPPGGDDADVIVRGTDVTAVAAAIADLGGNVEFEIGLIDAVSASVPAGMVDALRADARVSEVTFDAPVQLAASKTEPVDTQVKSNRGLTASQAMRMIGGGDMIDTGPDGTGIDVAVVDSGIEANGLYKVVPGIDVSMTETKKRDGYGHGTAMAGIIAGNTKDYRGTAPDARLIDVKVADANGVADVSQVLAGIDWVVSNRNTDGRNIRVLSLSFGTDGKNPASISPLAYAVEAAWRNNIVVVAAAGNHGDTLGRLTSPATDPFIIAVGALDLNGTKDWLDDTVPTWSASGDGVRNPDLIAPGKSLLGGKSIGSKIDNENPDASEQGFLLGSGTSQATAFVSGIVASMLEERPSLSPDEVKAMLINATRDLPNVPATRDGNGALDLEGLYRNGSLARTPRIGAQRHGWSDGSGSLDGDRGSFILQDALGNRLTGENTVAGSFDRDAWLKSTWSGSTWSGSTWSGSTWSGSTWSGSTWSGSTWSGSTWSGSTWSTVRWGQ